MRHKFHSITSGVVSNKLTDKEKSRDSQKWSTLNYETHIHTYTHINNIEGLSKWENSNIL